MENAGVANRSALRNRMDLGLHRAPFSNLMVLSRLYSIYSTSLFVIAGVYLLATPLYTKEQTASTCTVCGNISTGVTSTVL
jgi:hypothetical protein